MLKTLYDEYEQRFPFEKVSDRVYRVLLENITTNSTVLGKEFTITDITDDLGVSRTPVATAVKRLEKEGFVKQEKYRAVTVCSRESICSKNLYIARTALEMRAVEVVTRNITHKEFNRLAQIFVRSKEYVKEENIEGFIKSDDEFHSYLVECTKDDFIKEAYGYMKPYITSSRYSAPAYERALKVIEHDHQLILSCIQDGNSRMAREAMRIHMQTCSENSLFDNNEVFGILRLEKKIKTEEQV